MSRRPSERPGLALPPPSSETLRRAALSRSQQRGQQVARRRLAWRWTLWGLGQALKWLLPIVAVGAVVAALIWWLNALWLSPAPRPDGAVDAPAAAPAEPAAASAPTLPPARPPALPLRLDDGDAPAGTGVGTTASRAQSEPIQPTVADRSPP